MRPSANLTSLIAMQLPFSSILAFELWVLPAPHQAPTTAGVSAGYGAGLGFFWRNLGTLADHFRVHAVDLLGTGMSGGQPFCEAILRAEKQHDSERCKVSLWPVRAADASPSAGLQCRKGCRGWKSHQPHTFEVLADP